MCWSLSYHQVLCISDLFMTCNTHDSQDQDIYIFIYIFIYISTAWALHKDHVFLLYPAVQIAIEHILFVPTLYDLRYIYIIHKKLLSYLEWYTWFYVKMRDGNTFLFTTGQSNEILNGCPTDSDLYTKQ